MLAVLSTPTWDVDGYVVLEVNNSQTEGETIRRVNRVRTLDGGVVVVDAGASDGDRSIELQWMPTSKEREDNIKRLVQTYTRLNVSVGSGLYSAAPEAYIPGSNESRLRLLVVSKLSG